MNSEDIRNNTTEWRGSMSEIEYRYTDSNGHLLVVSVGRITTNYPAPFATSGADIPTDPAELHKLTEAIHGKKIVQIVFDEEDGDDLAYEPTSILNRKIAAIVYEDELPEVREGTLLQANGHFAHHNREEGANWLLNSARAYIAMDRHIEARDAAAKEAERAEGREVWALHDALWMSASAVPLVRDLVARRAYKLGARAPEAQ